jgi:hypothetical protein
LAIGFLEISIGGSLIELRGLGIFLKEPPKPLLLPLNKLINAL